jgi:hypothetical protein
MSEIQKKSYRKAKCFFEILPFSFAALPNQWQAVLCITNALDYSSCVLDLSLIFQ